MTNPPRSPDTEASLRAEITALTLRLTALERLLQSTDDGSTVTLKATTINVEALNINLTASMSFSATAAATATVKTSGELTLQGAMIMLN